MKSGLTKEVRGMVNQLLSIIPTLLFSQNIHKINMTHKIQIVA